MKSFPSTGSPQLDAAVQDWLHVDKNESTKAELLELVKTSGAEELERTLTMRMAFGTAGLRARMGPGYSCMNDVTVIQTSQGFAKYLLEHDESSTRKNGVIIGFDARHNSDRFAKLAALAMIRQGIPVRLFSVFTPTPLLAYGVLKYSAAAGIMVTASHNPKQDNGYKVFWNNGAQIIPPHDRNIAGHILQNLDLSAGAWDLSLVDTSPLMSDPYQEVYTCYYRDLESYVCSGSNTVSTSPLTITYTPMHGVGQQFMARSFQVFGLAPFVSVPQQQDPDPEFPTVVFPNPEEGKSALDLAMQTADAHNSQVIIANDPDADRLACAEKGPAGWKVFNGNELGAMMGGIALANHRLKHPDFPTEKLYMVASTVSSKFLKSMAAAEGFLVEECLTGFKWMANYAERRIAQGYKCLFAYEESIGYMYGTNVLDKDGISAGPVLAAFATKLYAEGTCLNDYLHSLYARYGYHISKDSYYLSFNPDATAAMFEAIRSPSYPTHCGTYKISHVRDVTLGYDSSTADNSCALPTDPSCHMITFTFENGCVATMRTSGTEPKIKYYTELTAKPGSGVTYEALGEQLQDMVDCLIREFFKPDVHDLKPKPL